MTLATQPCDANTEKKKKPIMIRASLFFDGTKNNKYNVNAASLDAKRRIAGTSYANDYSNVYRQFNLFEPYKVYDVNDIHIYIEGIGTTKFEDDSMTGYALGVNATGVEAKVKSGVSELLKAVIKKSESGQPILFLHIDVFGFSRGAAAARHFIHKAFNETPSLAAQIKAMGRTVYSVRVKFAGLYDTVSSVGGDMNFSDDVKELGLDAISLAEKVVQLAAGDEHRKNFALTDISSAGAKGEQYFLPGSHSDVGGGYTDQSGEDIQVFDLDSFIRNSDAQNTFLKKERQWFIQRGWYKDATSKVDGIEMPNKWNEIYGHRRGIKNAYTLWPLNLMTKHAHKSGWQFDADLIEEGKYKTPAALKAVTDKVEAVWAKGHAKGSGTQNSYWIDLFYWPEYKWLTELRYEYLHVSSEFGYEGKGMGPNWVGDGATKSRKRKIYRG